MVSLPQRITLASASPRRQQLLEQLSVQTVIRPAHADEESITSETVTVRAGETTGAAVARERALLKADAVPPEAATSLTLAADTVVACEELLLDKPENLDDAHRMLSTLSGRDHHVYTAVVLRLPGAWDRSAAPLVVDATTVTFAPLSEDEIQWYLATGEWQGVAGAYRIQGRASAFVTALRGSFSGVMGLPLHTVYSMLSALPA